MACSVPHGGESAIKSPLLSRAGHVAAHHSLTLGSLHGAVAPLSPDKRGSVRGFTQAGTDEFSTAPLAGFEPALASCTVVH
jgi:hypothetical protein